MFQVTQPLCAHGSAASAWTAGCYRSGSLLDISETGGWGRACDNGCGNCVAHFLFRAFIRCMPYGSRGYHADVEAVAVIRHLPSSGSTLRQRLWPPSCQHHPQPGLSPMSGRISVASCPPENNISTLGCIRAPSEPCQVHCEWRVLTASAPAQVSNQMAWAGAIYGQPAAHEQELGVMATRHRASQ